MDIPTPNLGLPQFESTDDLAFTDINGAFLDIDTLAIPTVCTSATRPTADLFVGREIYETDNKKILFWNGTGWVSYDAAGNDTGWQNVINIAGGWTTPGGQITWQARLRGNTVHVRGILVNAAFSGGFTKVCDLPAGIPKPLTDYSIPIGGNTTAARAFSIATTGVVNGYSSVSSSAWWSIWGSYQVD